MPGIKIINSTSQIKLDDKWVQATKFNSKDRLVDEKGHKVSSGYNGRQYRIIEKRERTFSPLERFGRGFLGTLAVICTLCLALFSKSVRNLFTKSKANIRFAVLEEQTQFKTENQKATPVPSQRVDSSGQFNQTGQSNLTGQSNQSNTPNLPFSPSEQTKLIEAANQGDSEAMYKVATHFLKEGPEQDIKVGIMWLELAAGKNYRAARVDLGNIYFKMAQELNAKAGPLDDKSEVAKLYEKAAHLVHVEGLYAWGLCLEGGIGTEKDEKKALSWFLAGCLLEFPPAMLKAGVHFAQMPDKENQKKGVDFIKKAADKDLAVAQFYYGQCLSKGIGFDQADENQAFTWFKKAADNGEADAINQLGSCYFLGKGCTQNHEEAYKLFKKAAAQGSREAANNLASLFPSRNTP